MHSDHYSTLARIMKYALLIVFYCLYSLSLSAQDYDTVYKELKQVIEEDSLRILAKNSKIDSLRKVANVQHELDEVTSLMDTYMQLSEEFKLFNYEQAFSYNSKALALAYRLNDKHKVASVKNKLGGLLVSGGIYHEAIDTLKSVDAHLLYDGTRIEYYGSLMRAHLDLKTFLDEEYYEHIHTDIAYSYVDSAQMVRPEPSPELIKVKALYFLSSWQLDSADRYFNHILSYPKFNLQDKAIAHSCLGLIYGSEQKRNVEKAKKHFAHAAINDFLLVNKEGQALIFLADYLFNEGNYDEAYDLIMIAKDDADHYGSLMRRRQASNTLTRIEGEILRAETNAKLKLVKYLLLGIVIILIAIVVVIIIFRRVLNLTRIKKMLESHNDELNIVNNQLREANTIKEKYIAQFFITNSEYLEKLKEISLMLNKILISKETNKISSILRKLNPKSEQDAFMKRFDELFISLFPTFIERIKMELKPDQEILIKSNHILNTELRIYALIRIGIVQNEEIARILNVSINTIYSYKTKLKNKVVIADDEFERFLMKIPSV